MTYEEHFPTLMSMSESRTYLLIKLTKHSPRHENSFLMGSLMALLTMHKRPFEYLRIHGNKTRTTQDYT